MGKKRKYSWPISLQLLFRPMYGTPDSAIQEIFACGIQNPGLWNLEYSSRNPESHWRLKSGIQYFESEMHGVESRIQDCLTTSVLLLTASLYLFH